ncbi:MAG: ABC transporter permease subunit [Thermoplasmata archaeon]
MPKKGWNEQRKAFIRSLKSGWKIYTRSKIGMAGLILILIFVIMAVFAPFLTPYTPEFKAPSVDVIRGDIYMTNLTTNMTWDKPPVGIIPYTASQGGNQYLKYVMVYNSHGQALLYPVNYTYVNNILKINLSSPLHYSIPYGTNYMGQTAMYAEHFTSPKTVVYYGFTNTTFYIMNNNFRMIYSYNFNRNIDYRSGFYNNPFQPPQGGQFSAIALANGTDVRIIFFYNAQLSINGMSMGNVHYNPVNIVNITLSSPVINNILLYINPVNYNSTMVIIPTESGLISYTFPIQLNQTYLNMGLDIPQKVLSPKVSWTLNYSVNYNNTAYSIRPQSLTYSNNLPSEYSEQNIILMTSGNNIIGINRINGAIEYITPFVVFNSTIERYKLEGIAGNAGNMPVAWASLGSRSVVAMIDPHTGRILLKTVTSQFYNVIDGQVNSVPIYDIGSDMIVISTDQGVYVFNNNMHLNQTFSIQGGMRTPVSGLGNVITYTSSTGYFYGVITNNNKLYLQMTLGTDIAPLPPGKYASGNTYILGTDLYGHDIWTWIVYGARAELIVGLVAAASSVLLGTFIGLISGYYGGWIDVFFMRLTDIFLSLPGLVVMLLLVEILGPSIWNVILVIAVLGWSGITRIIRAQVMSLKSRAFIDSARISGASNVRIMFVHIMPNILPLTFLFMSFGVSGAIITEASLAFLGFGDPHAITWGMMLQYIWTTGNVLRAPWWLIPPGLAITFLSMAFYFVGRAFDEIINPRLRRR